MRVGLRDLGFNGPFNILMAQQKSRNRSRSRSRSRTSSEDQDLLAPSAISRAKLEAHPPGEAVQTNILAHKTQIIHAIPAHVPAQLPSPSGSGASRELALRLSDGEERASFFELACSGEVCASEAGRSLLRKPLFRAHSRSELDRVSLDEILDLFEACPEPASPTSTPPAAQKLARLGLSRASNQPREWWEEYL